MMSKAEISRTKVKGSLIEQLALKGATKDHYIDLISDYMKLWDVKKALQEDIKVRGVTFKDYSSTGVMMQKNNPSVKELVMVNRQMLSILKELGLSTDNAGAGDGDDL
jgi:phage terminase small subunit